MYRVIDPVTVKVYVGKAGKRRSDTALLDRIREPHFGKRAESCDDWDKVVAITRVDPKSPSGATGGPEDASPEMPDIPGI